MERRHERSLLHSCSSNIILPHFSSTTTTTTMMLNRRRSSSVAVLVAATTMMMMTAADAYQVLPPPTCRRDFFVNSLVTAGVIMGAAVEPAEASARGYHISQKLKQEEQKKRLSAPIQAITPTGVAIQEYTKGRSGSEVTLDSLVTAEIKLVGAMQQHKTRTQFRLAEHPNLVGGFVDGLVGMKLNGERRIMVPAHLVEDSKKQGQHPLPSMSASQLETWFASSIANTELAYEVQVVGLS